MTFKITITWAKGNKQEVLVLPETTTLAALKALFKPAVSLHRKTFKRQDADGKWVQMSGETKTLKEFGITQDVELQYKDLGPQIGYRTVFVAEYAGPIAFMLMYAMRPELLYGQGAAAQPMSKHQQMWIGAFIAHFVKREVETFFVHKFSRPTMPFRNLFKNCSYYWAFAAVIGYFMCHPQYTEPTHGLTTIAGAGMLLMELGNLAVHLTLAGMRKAEGDQRRDAPKGGLFSLVSCPNYTFEIMSWVFFSLGTNIFMSWAFTAVGFAQMADWALKKHRGYVKAEPQLKKRKAIIPFVL